MIGTKKVLFILKEYPPISSPTDICVANVIEELKHNYEVFCLVKNSTVDRSSDEWDGVKIHRVRKSIWDSLLFRYKHAESKVPRFIRMLNRLFMRLNQLLTIPIYPINAPLYERRLSREAYELCLSNNIDCVVSVCNSRESVVAGAYAKKKLPCLIYIPYFIDAYACGTNPKYLPRAFSYNRRKYDEERLVKSADIIVAMESSKEYHNINSKYFNKIHFLNPPLFVNKRNKCDDELGILEKDMINIVYTGYIYLPDRDPRYIIEALRLTGRADLCLIFVGNNNCTELIESAKPSFPGVIKQHPFLPHNMVHGLLEGADVLLNLGVSNPSAISGKIFEYMSFCKPIITTYFNENEASLPYLRKYSASLMINQIIVSTEDAAALCNEFLDDIKRFTIDADEVAKQFYSSSPLAFADIIKGCLR